MTEHEVLVVASVKRETEWLGKFRDSIVIPLSQTDPEKWPIRSGRVTSLVSDQLAAEFFGDVRKLMGEGWAISEIAELFGNPSRIWRMSHHLLQGLRAERVDEQQIRESMLLLLGMVAALKIGGPFTISGANLLCDRAEVQRIAGLVSDAGRIPVSKSRLVHSFAASLWSYSEAIYFVAHEMGVEFHGPYETSEGEVLVVRDFFRPAPKVLWPEIENFLSFDRIRIAVTYVDLDGWLDVYNNFYFRQEGPALPSRASGAVVWCDDRKLSESDMREVRARAGAVISDVVGLVESWPLVEVARRYAMLFWWRKRELAEAAQHQWQPSEDVVGRITEASLPPEASSSPTVESLRRQFDLG